MNPEYIFQRKYGFNHTTKTPKRTGTEAFSPFEILVVWIKLDFLSHAEAEIGNVNVEILSTFFPFFLNYV